MASRPLTVTSTPPTDPMLCDSQAFENSAVVSTAPAILFGVVASNKSSSNTLWLMLFDSTTVPENGAVPMLVPLSLPPGASVELTLTPQSPGGGRLIGLSATNGLVWAVSTTAASLTLDTSSSVWASVWYV